MSNGQNIKKVIKKQNTHDWKAKHKAKDAVKLFDYIHSLDNQKLADVLAKQQKINKSLSYFIDVNIGNEIQKSGIPVNELDAFIIIVLMKLACHNWAHGNTAK